MPAAGSECFLEWHPWRTDSVQGLNHQLASLSCALGEARFLGRKLLFPSRICLDAKHEEAAFGSRGRKIDPSCQLPAGVAGSSVRAYSVPTSDLLDLEALGRLAPLLPADLHTRQANWSASAARASRPTSGSSSHPPVAAFDSGGAERLNALSVTEIDRSWRSARVASELPCAGGAAQLVRRRVSGFWFRPCAYKITDTASLAGVLAAAFRGDRAAQAGAAAPAHEPPRVELTHMLQSGLFYTRCNHLIRWALLLSK